MSRYYLEAKDPTHDITIGTMRSANTIVAADLIDGIFISVDKRDTEEEETLLDKCALHSVEEAKAALEPYAELPLEVEERLNQELADIAIWRTSKTPPGSPQDVYDKHANAFKDFRAERSR